MVRETLFVFTLVLAAVARTSTTTTTASPDVVVVAFANETVTFECDGHSDDHVLWKKSVAVVVTQATGDAVVRSVQHQNAKFLPYDVTQRMRHRRNKHSGDAALALSGVTPEDSGVYSCHSLHRDRATIKTWTLIVLDASLPASRVTSFIFYNGVLLKVSFSKRFTECLFF